VEQIKGHEAIYEKANEVAGRLPALQPRRNDDESIVAIAPPSRVRRRCRRRP
jgi:hypothetical protein